MLEVGDAVTLKDDAFGRMRGKDAAKFAGRVGIFLGETNFSPWNPAKARVLWHKRGNRGKEFEEIHRLDDLVRIES